MEKVFFIFNSKCLFFVNKLFQVELFIQWKSKNKSDCIVKEIMHLSNIIHVQSCLVYIKSNLNVFTNNRNSSVHIIVFLNSFTLRFIMSLEHVFLIFYVCGKKILDAFFLRITFRVTHFVKMIYFQTSFFARNFQ
jgi:hypothetical protein